MNKIDQTGRRVTRSYRQTIEASAVEVFPLLCPVREVEWLEGWTFSPVYLESGLIELGGVFTTRGADGTDTVWVTTKHDRERGIVEFTRFTHNTTVCVLQIVVTPGGATRSFVDITYTYTSLGVDGDRFLDSWTEEAFLSAVTFWEKSMNHFLKTGC